MASMASLVLPDPSASNALTAMIWMFQLTPTTPSAVVADGADGAGDVRAVIIVVHRVSIVVDEVIAVDIVNKSVPVVVHSGRPFNSWQLVHMFCARSWCV